MHLRKITLFNFKNYDSTSFEFSEGLNCILGDNGVGKTNLLDAIHFLSLTKSAFSSSDTSICRSGMTDFSVRGDLENEGFSYTLIYSGGLERKNNLKINGDSYDRLADHIGKFPSILVHPHDVDYIRMGSELRRKLFDVAISQEDPNYLRSLIVHNRVLKQRNQSLKMMREAHRTDAALLDSYDEQLFSLYPDLFQARKNYIEKIISPFQSYYLELSEDREKVDILYSSQLASETFKEDFQKNRERDITLARTTMGFHKDDFEFTIDSMPVKTFGSQGQQKAFMLALKLCPLEFCETDRYPLLLLDDVFDRLDTRRIHALLNMISKGGGQVFLTDARPDRVHDILKSNKLAAHVIEVQAS